MSKRDNCFSIFNINKRRKVAEQACTSNDCQFDDQICNQVATISNENVAIDEISAVTTNQTNVQADNQNQLGGQSSYFSFNLKTKITNDAFGVSQTEYDIESNEKKLMTFAAAIQNLNTFFKEIHQKFVVPLNKYSRIQIMFNHDAFSYPVSIGFLKKNQMTIELMKNQFESTCQSYKHKSKSMICSDLISNFLAIKFESFLPNFLFTTISCSDNFSS